MNAALSEELIVMTRKFTGRFIMDVLSTCSLSGFRGREAGERYRPFCCFDSLPVTSHQLGVNVIYVIYVPEFCQALFYSRHPPRHIYYTRCAVCGVL